MMDYMAVNQLPYRKNVLYWLKERYGEEQAASIWKQTKKTMRRI